MKIHISENGISNEAIGAISTIAEKANKEMTLENFSILLATLEENGKKWEVEDEGIFRTEKNGNITTWEGIYYDGVHGRLKYTGGSETPADEEILEDMEEKIF